MKEFINKIFSNQKVTIEELSKFIIDYCELCGIKDTTPEQLQLAVQFIQQGIFDLNYACKNCASKLGLQVVEVKDKNGAILYTKIQENSEQ